MEHTPEIMGTTGDAVVDTSPPHFKLVATTEAHSLNIQHPVYNPYYYYTISEDISDLF